MKRAAVSISSNIAEGQARQGRVEFIRFLQIANGSLAELDTQRIIASKLGFFPRSLATHWMSGSPKSAKCFTRLTARLKTEN